MVGFINVYKPREMSSAAVVSIIRKKFRCKCGHMGTLDPLAIGVLPIGLNQANRLFGFLLDKRKSYIATFDFAFQTPSYDLETEIVKRASYIPTRAEIEAILPDFIGKIDQVPPEYSAKMVDGSRSYKLARQGEKVTLKPKTVEILDIKLIEQVGKSSYKFEIVCRGGTYIRSIARDLGARFGCPATMTQLERTSSGVFGKESSVTIEQIEKCENLNKLIIKPDSVLSFPNLILSNVLATRMLNGLYDDFSSYTNGLYKVYNEQEFWGVGEIIDGKLKMRSYVRDI